MQTPALFLPDARPPRLTEEAKKAIRALAAFLHEDRPDPEDLTQAYQTAVRLAGSEVEPRVVYGLILLKGRDRQKALSHFEQLRTDQPELWLAPQSLAWLRFSLRAYQAGVDELVQMVLRLPKPKTASAPWPEDLRNLFTWAGQLREFAAEGQETRQVSPESLQKLDAAVADCGEEPTQFYQQGREKTRSKLRDFDKQLFEASDKATKLKIRIDRRQLSYFASFPFTDATQRVLAGMDR